MEPFPFLVLELFYIFVGMIDYLLSLFRMVYVISEFLFKIREIILDFDVMVVGN